MKWFKHDSNASIDAKIERLIMKYGISGYGMYFYCLEMISRSVEKHNLTFELEHDAEIIAHRLNMNSDIVQEMMAYMVDLGLFENDGGVITCLKMATRTDDYIGRIANKAINSEQTPNKLRSNSEQTPNKVVVNRIEENRIDENRKKTRRFTPPTLSEVNQYISDKGYQVDGNAFINHYESVNWYRGKTKIKDWKACVRTWVKTNAPKQDDYGRGGL